MKKQSFFTVLFCLPTTCAFIPNRPRHAFAKQRSSCLLLNALAEIETMKLKEIRSELESYGISTKTFLEKQEFVDALTKAREDGKTPSKSNDPKNEVKTSKKEKKTSKEIKEDSKGEKKDSKDEKKISKEDQIKDATEKAKAMKVSELKKQLTEWGISTKSFFEKRDFVEAYAKAVVDGVKGQATSPPEEEYDPSFRDVMMQKFDARDQRMLQGLIDIKLGS